MKKRGKRSTFLSPNGGVSCRWTTVGQERGVVIHLDFLLVNIIYIIGRKENISHKLRFIDILR
jgi:hypothetical protein